MKHVKFPKPIPRVTSRTIDAEVLERINAKIAQALEYTDKAIFYQKKKHTGGTASSHYSIGHL